MDKKTLPIIVQKSRCWHKKSVSMKNKKTLFTNGKKIVTG